MLEVDTGVFINDNPETTPVIQLTEPETEPGLGFKEFVEGGHHYVDSYPGYKRFIPEDEIWVDDVFKSKPEELKAIIQHEFIERNLMKYKKWSYNKAHEYANKREAELRKK